MTTDTAPRAAPPAAPRTSDAIDAWLDRLVRLVRFRPRQAREMREELDGHLRDRVRDLMLAGHDEPEAVHRAIAELGDLALLARRYREAQSPRIRRLAMHTAFIALAGAGLALGTFNLSHQPEPHPEESARIMLERLMLKPYVDETRGTISFKAEFDTEGGYVPLGIDATFRLAPEPDDNSARVAADTPDLTLADFLTLLASESGARLYVYWADVAQALLSPDSEVPPLPLEGQSIARALTMANDILGRTGQDRIDFRIDNGLMEFARGEFFDRRERRLATYDVAAILNAGDPLETSAESETLINLITTIAEPDAWQQNGGDLASIYAAGRKLFVNAPPRVHERVAWVLEELRSQDRRIGKAIAPGTSDILIPPLLMHLEGEIRQATGPWIFPLTHTPAHDAARAVESVVGRIGGRAAADPRTNSVLVAGDRTIHDLAATILAAMDTSKP